MISYFKNLKRTDVILSFIIFAIIIIIIRSIDLLYIETKAYKSEIEKREIAGQMLEMYVIEFEKEKMTQRVPVAKINENGVRKVSSKNQLKEIFEILTGKAKIRRTMWSRRAQEYEAKINSGDIKLLTEVVRDLFRSDSQPEQSYSERQLYEASRERLAREVAVIEKTDEQKAIVKMETILNNSNERSDDLMSEEAN